MNKLETMQQLPSAAPAAVEKMRQLEKTLATFEETMAASIHELHLQTDEVASILQPVVDLRDDLIEALSNLANRSKESAANARDANSRAEKAAIALEAQAESILNASQQQALLRLRLWHFAGVACLAAVLAVGFWKLLPLEPKILAIDSNALGRQVTAALIEYNQQQRQQQRNQPQQ